MSYRTYIEDAQIFGNNEDYQRWIDFLATQDIIPDEDGQYNGYITDVMGMFTTLENIVMDIEARRQERITQLIQKNETQKSFSELKTLLNQTQTSIFNFEDIYFLLLHSKPEKYGRSLLDELISLTENGYMFLPYTALKACEHKLEPNDVFSTDNHFNCYKLKSGEKIHVRAG